MSLARNFIPALANGDKIHPADILSAAGRIFWVLKSDATGYAKFFTDHNTVEDNTNSVYNTIDAAVSACVAGRGDIIYVGAGHTETISSATALLLDVAGVTIIGLGFGNARPTITLDTATTATIPVSAANITIKNVIFSANFADIAVLFTLTTAKSFRLEDCDFVATAANMNFISIVTTSTTDNAADGLDIINCRWIEPDTATTTMVFMNGNLYGMRIVGNFIRLGVNDNKPCILAQATGKVSQNGFITDNIVYRLNTDTATGAFLVTTDQSTNRSVIARNLCQHADTAGDIIVTASSGYGCFDNKQSGVAGASGYLAPGADS